MELFVTIIINDNQHNGMLNFPINTVMLSIIVIVQSVT